MRYRALVPAACLILLAAVLPALADPPSTESRLYRVDKDTTFQRGCFAPCLCPVMETANVRGTFILTFTGSDSLFDYYDVMDVNWIADDGAGFTARITGSGTYRIGGEFAREHRLELDLQVGSDPVQHFDSGRVIGGSEFPRIVIAISIHGGYCFDTVIGLKARPTMKLDVGPALLWWEGDGAATGFDLVRGDLRALWDSGGDFAAATLECLGDDVSGGWLPYAQDPPPGGAYWFLARQVYGGAEDTYDEPDPAQVGTRDPGLAASTASCP